VLSNSSKGQLITGCETGNVIGAGLRNRAQKTTEDKWIRTLCGRCYASCAIRVHVIGGVAVKIEGEPESRQGSSGGVCGKGLSGLQMQYDPNRLNVPLKRTNPEKGLHVDPKWKEITWEEAYAEIVPRLKKIITENPNELFFQWTTSRSDQYLFFGQNQFIHAICGRMPDVMSAGGGGLHCGKAAHSAAGMVYSSWSIVPDFKYCNYALFFGSSKGTGSGHSAMFTARLSAEARRRGMKTVSFDPICNFSGGKATEWVPIIPGTDGMVALALCNVIVNELGKYDAVFLRTKTNAPYLVGPDLKYVRENGPARGILYGHSGFWEGKPHAGLYIGDDDTNKPMVWDAGDNRAKVYDDPSIRSYSLEGNYEYRGIQCQPVFQAVKEHLKQYTPEKASDISSIPAEKLRRIASEFLNAANIGGTIEIEGQQLPLRPASAVIFRGGQGHENGLHACFAVSLLNQLVGSADVPGGTLGWPAKSSGFPATGQLHWSPYKGVDGLLETDRFGASSGLKRSHGPWPVAVPENNQGLNPNCITTMGHIGTNINFQSDRHEIWNKMGCRDHLKMMISWGCNSVLSIANHETVAECLKEIPYIVVYDLVNNELTEGFADIVLPAVSYLEDCDCSGFSSQGFNQAFGHEDWYCHVFQPVVEIKAQRRQWQQVLYDLACRLGKKEEFFKDLNESLDLAPDEQFQLTDSFSAEELANRICRTVFGKNHDLGWFKTHGFIHWPKKIEDAYWRPFCDARTPIYLEHLVEMKEKIEAINKETGLGFRTDQFTPYISWTPSSIHQVDNPGFDLYCFSYRDIIHSGTFTMEQPWIDEVSRMNPYTYNITLNRQTAEKKGLKEGDIIEIENLRGYKVTGRLKLMEGQHPQVIGIATCGGHWTQSQPIARGKGTNFNELLELDQAHLDPICTTLETCVRVKVRKIG
jgi:anaerobic selenocysteine-containing dehydrogenase